jgi:transposase InsO family protein
MMDLVEDLVDPAVSVVSACVALGLSRATLYRATTVQAVPSWPERPPSPRRLTDAERAAVVAVMHSPEFVDQPPAEVYATLLSRGVYLAAIRTMYRLLSELGETKERRNQRRPRTYAKPSLTVTGPNQVWTWDITKLATNAVGVFLHAYVIIDLFSRYVVGWMVASKESKDLAAQLFAETIARHGVEPGLTVHADRGSAMKSDTLAQLLAALGVERSFSRPHVSDDNAFSEAQFKTMKYQPDYPGRFSGELHARGWLATFFGWHNDEHHHSGLAMFTPAEVFFGRVERVRVDRQAALDEAYQAHRERFPNGAPRVALPPHEVSINPITSSTVSLVDDAKAPLDRGDIVLGPEASAPPTPPTHPRFPALASGPSQRAALAVPGALTPLGALPATPAARPGPSSRHAALPS